MTVLICSLSALLVLAAVAALLLLVRLRRKEAAFTENVRLPEDTLEIAKTAVDQFLYDKCCRYMMDKKPFLVDGFSLKDLSLALCCNRGRLSKTINRYSGKNFRQYVNYYRVMYSLDLFRKNPGLRAFEMAALSGFHSPTTYYQSFKMVMGESPSAWCRRTRRKNR